METAPSSFWTSSLRFVLLATIVLCYLVLAATTAATRAPYSDEAWFASPALNLLNAGNMGTSVLVPAGLAGKEPLTGIEQHTYWVTPLHLLLQAAWYKLVGFSLLKMRALSIIFGALVVVALFFLTDRLVLNVKVALLSAALVAVDPIFVYYSADGRMDVMCAGFGFAGLALYLYLRERSLAPALVAANILICASMFTNPNGILPFLGLVFLALHFDRQRLEWKHSASLIPYFLAAAAYGFYILQAPGDYLRQIHSNGSGRFGGFAHPIAAFEQEISQRYLATFGFGDTEHRFAQIKLLVLLAYVTGFAAVLGVRSWRNSAGARVLLGLLAIYFLMMTFFNFKLEHYLVSILPLFAALLALAIQCAGSEWPRLRALFLSGMAGVLLIQIATCTHRILDIDDYDSAFRPAVQFIEKSFPADTKLVGDPSFAFGVGFDRIQQDDTVGYYSGQIPAALIRTSPFAEEQMEYFENNQPRIAAHISEVLHEDMDLAYDHPPYKIYVRRPPVYPAR